MLRVFVGTGLWYVLLLAGSLVLWPARAARERWRDVVRRRWAASMLRALAVRAEIRGTPPPAPFLLVANHLSYVDILLLMASAGGVFVAKAEIGSWPLIGHLCRVSGTLLIDRDSKRDLLRIAELIEAQLELGGGVVLFPEGTTGPGDALLPFKPSLLEVAVRSGRPVWNATLSYRSPPDWPPPDESICWWRDMLLVPHVWQLLHLPWIGATLDYAPDPTVGDDRKDLTERLRRAMAERFVPSAPAGEPSSSAATG